MNRQNFLGHLALALTIVLVAAFAGQLRRMDAEREAPPKIETAISTLEAPPPPPAMGEAPEGPAEVLVRFRPGTSLKTIHEITARLNDRLEDRIESVNNLAVIEDEDGLDAQSVVAEYSALPEVEYAEPDYAITLDPQEDEGYEAEETDETVARSHSGTTPNDPMFDQQWALANTGDREGKAQADIKALTAWEKTKGSNKVVVAVLDSGVDYLHPDLKNNMWTRPASIAAYTDDQFGRVDDVHGFNAADGNGDPMDENGHGTHCAGIIGAEGGNEIGITGVNWQVQIMPLKFMSAGGFGTTKAAIEAINYVIDRRKAGVNVRIISASWGSRMRSKALEDVIRKAGEEGILFVAASGNSSADADRNPHYPSNYDLPNVISVAALNRRDELASFSNYGAKTVHIAAPGAEILSTWLDGGFEEHSGTSMATPVVSGVAALVLSVDPNLSIKELRERLLTSVDHLSSLDGKVSSGGRINAAHAVGVK